MVMKELEELADQPSEWEGKRKKVLSALSDAEKLGRLASVVVDLIEGVRAMQQMLRDENRLPTSEDFDYLAEWLTRHIVGQDMRLGFYLAEVMA